MSDCPDVRTQQGSRQFNAYYHLARDTLLGAQ
jgi:hypothetical protein